MLTWTTLELADILGQHPNTIRNWIRNGKLRGVKTCNLHGYEVTTRALFEYLDTDPRRKLRFLYRLTHDTLIGDKVSTEVEQYLKRKGYIR